MSENASYSKSNDAKKAEKSLVKSSKSPFKSKYATQKYLRKSTFHHTKNSLISISNTKALVKETIQKLGAKNKDRKSVMQQNNVKTIEGDKDSHQFYHDTFVPYSYFDFGTSFENRNPNRVLNKQHKERTTSNGMFWGNSYENYFYDESGSKINFECRKHSGIRILLRGDLLGALNCFFPQLNLIPSEPNGRKPILNKNFSNYSYAPKEMESIFALARKCRNEARRKHSLQKDKTKLQNLIELFLFSTLKENEKNTRTPNELTNNKDSCKKFSQNVIHGAIKKYGNNLDLDRKAKVNCGNYSSMSLENDSSTELLKLSKSEPHITSQIDNFPITFKRYSMEEVSQNNLHSLPENSGSHEEDVLFTNDASHSFLIQFLTKFYPERLNEINELERIMLKMNEFAEIKPPSKDHCTELLPNPYSYSSVLKNSMIPKKENIQIYITENINNALENKYNHEVIKEKPSAISEKSWRKKHPVVYNQEKFEKSIITNLEKILEDEDDIFPASPNLINNNIFSLPPPNYVPQFNNTFEPTNTLLEHLNFLRLKEKRCNLDQFFNPTAFRNNTALQYFNFPNETYNQFGCNPSTRMHPLTEYGDVFNGLMQMQGNLQSDNLAGLLNRPVFLNQQPPNLYFPWNQTTNPLTTMIKNNTAKRNNSRPLTFQNQNNCQISNNNNALFRPKINVGNIISASDLEKQAIEQYRQSEENLNHCYEMLEKEAEEQYKSNYYC